MTAHLGKAELLRMRRQGVQPHGSIVKVPAPEARFHDEIEAGLIKILPRQRIINTA